MDHSEATDAVIKRITSMEPEHSAKKIIGYMYLQDIPTQEMIRLALGPDNSIHDLIHKAKTALSSTPSQVFSRPISPTLNPLPSLSDQFLLGPFPSFSPPPFPSPSPFRMLDPNWGSQLPLEQPAMQSDPLQLMPYHDYTGVEEPLDAMVPNDYYCNEAAFNSLHLRGGRNSCNNLMDFPKTCHYFMKGYCRNGSNCKYFHGDIFSSNAYDVSGEEGFSPGSLEKLDFEISELLKSRNGNPVSIASLPMLYFDRYKKTLQAEGYLTESQRHGKAGYSLTKLLARLKSIRLIDRPHGQHAVILSEDAAKYPVIRAERNDPGPIVSGSRQIYMTFPAESTFTDEDISNYFSKFGTVHDVRIPCQDVRMYGFVTFASADTVQLILSKASPHYVCGCRVLAKPYRDKGKHVERKYSERFDHPPYFQPYPQNINLELQTGWETSRLNPRQLLEDHEHAVELEAACLSQLQLAGRPVIRPPCSGSRSPTNELRVPEGRPRFPSRERLRYLLYILNSIYTRDDNRPKYPVIDCGDQESSQGGGLTDSPFASAVGSSVPSVI